MVRFERELLAYMHREQPHILVAIAEQKEITDEIKAGLETAIKTFKQSFMS